MGVFFISSSHRKFHDDGERKQFDNKSKNVKKSKKEIRFRTNKMALYKKRKI